MAESVFLHGPVFRPTETQRFSRCPAYWYYTHVEGWEPALPLWSPEIHIGTALHAGMAAYWRGEADPVEQAEGALLNLWPEDAPEVYSKDSMLELVAKCADRMLGYLGRELGDCLPVMVEQPLGEDGHTTPDVVVRDGRGLGVIDLKYHHAVAPDRISYRFEHLDRDHQFNHYPWAVSEYLGEPVRWFRKLGVIGQPKIVVRAEMFEITPDQQAAWLQSARAKWHQMDMMKNIGPAAVYQRQEGCRMYGDKYPCPMEAACWTCYGDREAMTKFYTRKGDGNGQ